VGSTRSPSSSASNHIGTAAYTYNIGRFDRQHKWDASTIYARIPTNPSDPHPTGRVHIYITRAAGAIEAFDIAFGINPRV
jgi:hypothetical protein